MTLYLFKFNNYYNRIIKKRDTIDEYGTYLAAFESTNFIPNDGVYTEHVVNYSGEVPDYLIVVNENNDIVSRWYIISSKRTRAGQYKLELYRDVIVDWYDNIVDAPAFIEKAILKRDNPLIFNKEDMSYNQIKTAEIPLVDSSRCSWIVGYMASNTPETTINYSVDYNLNYDYLVNSSYDNWDVKKYMDNGLRYSPDNFEMAYTLVSGTNNCSVVFFDNNYDETEFYRPTSNFRVNCNKEIYYNMFNTDIPSGATYTDLIPPNSNMELSSSLPNNFLTVFKDVHTLYKPYYDYINNSTELNDILKYDNKIVKFVDGENVQYKLIKLKSSTTRDTVGGTYYKSGVNHVVFMTGNNTTAFFNNVQFNTRNAEGLMTGINNRNNQLQYSNYNINPGSATSAIQLIANLSYRYYTFEVSDAATTNLTATIKGPNDRTHLDDSPYDMFCIPYKTSDESPLLVLDNNTNITVSSEISFATAQAFIREIGGENGYIKDIQLLPYCPISKIIGSGRLITNNLLVSDISYIKSTVNNVEQTVGFIFYPSKSSFTLNIPYSYNPENVKMDSETLTYRLSSPNYNGQFEFNPAKNNGISYFNVDCTYKPFSPYIHINPNFGGLYGNDYNDARGLICGGDFSLPMITDAWAQYQIQNKNYQQIFARQIENMEIQNNVQRGLEIGNIITGALGGGAALAGAGLMTGNPLAAGIAGTIGGAFSLGGGIADYQLNEILRSEAINYTQDNFGYQLGNIRALPQSITKTTAFTYNNKIFPILEIYDCTEEEKKALANKIAYNGMTVMRIGTINEFLGNTWSWTAEDGSVISSKGYIKGRLIRLTNIDEDFHVVDAIGNELYKGVFI